MKHLTIVVVNPDERVTEKYVQTLKKAGYNCAGYLDLPGCQRQLDTIGLGGIVLSLDFCIEDLRRFIAAVVSNKRYRHIPIVGILASAPSTYHSLGNYKHDFFHFLDSNPSDNALIQIVESGFSSYQRYVSLVSEIKSRTSAIGLITSGTFHLRTPKECENLTTMLSLACPDPSAVALGLSELLINAVEHGNLGISYEEKTGLINTGKWDDEVAARLKNPQYANRKVEVQFERVSGEIRIRITDEGDGFDWQAYMMEEPISSVAHHGRGISLARLMGFHDLKYNETGNSVLAIIELGQEDPPEPSLHYHI